LRLRQLARQFNMRLEERVSERTRIARDLHDTLLQSFHGLMFQFQAARNMLPRRPDEAMDVLDSAIGATEQAITEGRSAIQQLRSEQVDKGDLALWLTNMGQELARSRNTNGNSAIFRVTVEGEQQPCLRYRGRKSAGLHARFCKMPSATHRRITSKLRFDTTIACFACGYATMEGV
jgi:signal transduction histidine kinase